MSNKQINFYILGLSVGVPILIVTLIKLLPANFTEGIDLNFFPKFNASINFITFLTLIFAFVAIKKKQIKVHQSAMLFALFLSCLFLVSYLFYHTLKGAETKYLGVGMMKTLYYFILLTHILISAIILPLVLKTFSFAFITKDFVSHRKFAKFILPLWLYVAITGVLIYLFLAPYY